MWLIGAAFHPLHLYRAVARAESNSKQTVPRIFLQATAIIGGLEYID